MAFCLGSSAEVGAFLVAFRLANLFRRLLGEGNLQAGFVPQFESFRGSGFARAVHFYREAALSLTLLSLAVILICEGVLWSIFDLLDPSWQQIASLTMWMLPGLLFICLSGLNQALLQSQKKYFLPAVTPVVFNGVWIIAAIYSKTITALAIWVTIGAALQWVISSFYVKKEFFGVQRCKRRYFSPDCLQLIRLMTLGLMGIAAAQLNSALDAIFARVADLSGPVYLWYAVRLQHLPLALFGLALSGALLPPLSRAIQNQEMDRFEVFLDSALRRAALLIIPSSFGLIALGGAGLNVLYRHGHFSIDDVQRTLECLWAYAIGLIPSAFVLLLSQAFYAKNLYWVPARTAFVSVLANMMLNAIFVFVFKWGALSIALATSLSSILNCYLLIRPLWLNLTPLLVRLCGRLTIASSLAAFLTLLVQYGVFGGLALTGWDQGIQLCSLGGIYLGALLGSLYLLRVGEGKQLLIEIFQVKKPPLSLED